MIHSTKHMEQSNKASYVKKAVDAITTTTHSVEDTAEQAQHPISTVKERVAQWQDKMVRWQGGVKREATDIATKTRNGKDAVGIDDSHREILTTNAAPKTESKNLEFNTKITFEEQELEPVIRKKLLNKVAQHEFNQDIYDASIISYKILHNYEDLVWLMKKFDIHHPLMDDGIDLLEKDPFYLKEVMSATLGVSMFYFSGNLAIPYSVLSNFLHKECGLVGSITTKVGEVFGYENLGAKYCNEVAGADLVISSILAGYAGYGLPFLIYSASNIAIRVSSIAAEHLLEQEHREAAQSIIYKAASFKEVLLDCIYNPLNAYGTVDILMDITRVARSYEDIEYST